MRRHLKFNSPNRVLRKERFLCFTGIQKGFSGIKHKIFTGTLKNLKKKNSLYSLIEASLEPKYSRSFGRTSSKISVYLYEKNKPYPENYIGRTPKALVKRFGISEKEAVQFIPCKLL